MNMVLDWNNVLLEAIQTASIAPPVAARAMAMVQTAVFDAVNAIEGSPYEGYAVHAGASGLTASTDAAVAGAAFHILSALFPAQQSVLAAHYEASLAKLGESTSVQAGLAYGKEVASEIIALRLDDGASTSVQYTPQEGLGNWEPTAPAYASALLPQWPYVSPWAMHEGDQFRPDAPPSLTSDAYTNAFNEVKSLGALNSTIRTEEQTTIAKFWASGAGTKTPPGQWQQIAQDIAASRGLDTLESAKLFATVSVALADAAIAAWDTKYAYNNWRPITAIAQADADGNPLTLADPDWKPLLTTPPFPDYISGHSTFSAAAAQALAAYLGSDTVSFKAFSDAYPESARQFNSLMDAAREAGQSRIYGGIHWQFANQVGLATGASVGGFVGNNFFLEQEFATEGHDVHYSTKDGVRVVNGLAGNDTMLGNIQDDKLYGGEGADTLFGFTGNDWLNGDAGDDALGGEEGHDSIRAGNGNDTLWGGAGNDSMQGGEGADHISGDDGEDLITGGAGNDTLCGDAGQDTLRGGEGNDTIWGWSGADALYGDAGNDLLGGDAGDDFISGGEGDDALFGDSGNDTLNGDAGNDTLSGGDGSDVLIASAGSDQLYGGAGADSFRFNLLQSQAQSTLADFSQAEDRLQIDQAALGEAAWSEVAAQAVQGALGIQIVFGQHSLLLSGMDIADIQAITVEIL